MSGIPFLRNIRRAAAQGLNTITAKVLWAMLVIILPVNIFAVILSSLAIGSARLQAEQAVASILENHLADIEKRLSSRHSMLLSLKDSSADAVVLNKQRGDAEYIKAKARFFNLLNSLIHMDSTTSGCFYYYSRQDDMLLLGVDSSLHYQADMDAYVREMLETQAQSGWYLAHIPGSKAPGVSYPVLFLFTTIGDVYYGTWIELDGTARGLAGELAYTGMAVSFTDAPPEPPAPGATQISAVLRKAALYLNVSIPKGQLSGNLQVFHILLIISAVLGFLLIPFLFIWLNRLVLKPLRWIHKGHQEMENGNQNYRITRQAKTAEFRESIQSFNHMADSIRHYQKYGEYLLREKIKSEEGACGEQAEKPSMDGVADYIANHQRGEDLTVNSVAEAFHFHPVYLNRIFKKDRGMSIGQFIIESRMNAAAAYLALGQLSVNEVAERVGYRHYPNFYKMFKKHYNCTPSQYLDAYSGELHNTSPPKDP